MRRLTGMPRRTVVQGNPEDFVGSKAELSRYVVLNPLRAGLVKDVGDWAWSTYCATIGELAAPDWLCTEGLFLQFGNQRNRCQRRYQKICLGRRRFAECVVGREGPGLSW